MPNSRPVTTTIVSAATRLGAGSAEDAAGRSDADTEAGSEAGGLGDGHGGGRRPRSLQEQLNNMRYVVVAVPYDPWAHDCPRVLPVSPAYGSFEDVALITVRLRSSGRDPDKPKRQSDSVFTVVNCTQMSASSMHNHSCLVVPKVLQPTRYAWIQQHLYRTFVAAAYHSRALSSIVSFVWSYPVRRRQRRGAAVLHDNRTVRALFGLLLHLLVQQHETMVAASYFLVTSTMKIVF